MALGLSRSNVESSGFMDALKQIHRTTGIGMKQIFQWQMALFIRDAMLHTQSRGTKSYPAQFDKAQKSVKADIRRMFVGYKGGKDDMYWDGRPPREAYIETKTRKKDGAVYVVPRDMFKSSASEAEMSAWHRAHFARRKQRIPGGREGKWKVCFKMHVPDKDLKRFIVAKQKNIGKAKAGWLKGLRHYTALAPAGWLGADKTPEWVRRNVGASGVDGSVSESWSEQSIKGFLLASNGVEYSRGDMRIAMEKRTKDMMKYAPLRLEKILNQLEIKVTMIVTVTT